MKITINAVYDIEEYNLIIDDEGRFWQLPFKDKAGRNFPVKQLHFFFNTNYPVIRVQQKLLSEKALNKLRIVNKRKLVFEIKDTKKIKGAILVSK